MRGALWVALILSGRALMAAPYAAYVAGVPVHSASPDARVMVADLAGGDPVCVSDGLSGARDPAWSPDGRLAFEAVSDGRSDIYVCGPDGSGRVNITERSDGWHTSPVFVDGRRIAYLTGPDRTVIRLASIESGGESALCDQPRFYGRAAASPDGSTLAVFGADRLAGPGHLCLVPTDGSGARPLTTQPGQYSTPSFSPDGQSVAVSFDLSASGGGRGVGLIAIPGGDLRVLADGGYPLGPVSFSPDGTRIAYVSAESYHNTWVALVGIDGANRERLDVGPFHVTGWPSFSPDGVLLAFQGVQAAVYGVFVKDLTTGEMTRLCPTGDTGVQPAFSH